LDVKNKFFGWKHKSLVFPATRMAGLWTIVGDTSFFFFFGKEWGIIYYKKNKGPHASAFFMGLTYLALDAWSYSFIFFIYFFKNHYIFICIFKNNFCIYVLINTYSLWFFLFSLFKIIIIFLLYWVRLFFFMRLV
jgi:hypothetical protein